MTEGTTPTPTKAITSALTRYRIMAWAAGIGLLLLCLNMYLRYVQEVSTPLDLVPRIHGFVYMGYLITVFDLSFRMKWSLTRGVLVCLAGTVPFLSFVVEHQITRQTRAELTAA